MSARVFYFVLGWVFAAILFCVIAACSPADKQTIREVAPPITNVTCVLLKRLAPSGLTNTLCATADDLLPFVDDIFALHEARQSGEEPGKSMLAFTLEPPKRPVVRRRCLAWQELQPTDRGADSGQR